MTDKELHNAKEALRKEIEANGFGWQGNKYVQPTEEFKKKRKELDCVDMINSILAYNCMGYQNANDVLRYEEEESYKNYLKDYVDVLGRDRVLELIQGQIDSISYVKTDVFTDDEGLSYNSIQWKD